MIQKLVSLKWVQKKPMQQETEPQPVALVFVKPASFRLDDYPAAKVSQKFEEKSFKMMYPKKNLTYPLKIDGSKMIHFLLKWSRNSGDEFIHFRNGIFLDKSVPSSIDDLKASYIFRPNTVDE